MVLLARVKESLVRDWPSYGVIVLAAGIQLLLVSRSLDFLITNVLPDDAFYYFQIARNISEGHGVAFDGVELANGFHPLWLLILVPIYNVFSVGGIADAAPIQAALYLSTIFNLITAFIVYRLIKCFTDNHLIRAFALAVWCLNPFLLFETINGLETSLALMLTSLFFLVVVRRGEHTTMYQDAGLGVLAGFMILARLDLALYLAVFLIWMLIRGDFTRVVWVSVLRIGGVATLLTTPWFIWNWYHFGMVLTSAANVNSLVTRTLIAQDNGSTWFQAIKGTVYVFDDQVRGLFLRFGASAFVLGMLGAAGALATTGALVLPRRLKEISVHHALFGGFLLLFVLNAGVRLVGRGWYFVSAEFFVVMLASIVLAAVYAQVRYPRMLTSVLLLFVLFNFYVSWSKHVREQYAPQAEMYAAALWGNEHLPEGTILGSFNSGIQGYFSTHRVVNLDGLVNQSAYEALSDKELWSYIEDTHIEYLSDFDIYLDYRYRSFFGVQDIRAHLREISRIVKVERSRSTTGIGIYEVVP